jgi:hypothetical protein
MKGKYIKGKYILCFWIYERQIYSLFVFEFMKDKYILCLFYHKVNLSNVNILWSFFTALCAKRPKVGSCLFKNREGLVQGRPKFKRPLWGDKPEGLLPENCPNFFFFFCLGRDPLGTCDKPRLWGRKNFSFLWDICKRLQINIFAVIILLPIAISFNCFWIHTDTFKNMSMTYLFDLFFLFRESTIHSL